MICGGDDSAAANGTKRVESSHDSTHNTQGSRWRVLDDWFESGYKGFLKYRKWLLLGSWLCVAIIIGGPLLLVGIHQVARWQRDAAYHAILQSYQKNLKSGVTRKEVESYLHARNAPFVEGPGRDLVVMVGEEKFPWYVWWCGSESVYVDFQFIASEGNRTTEPNGMDELKGVFLSRRAEGCLDSWLTRQPDKRVLGATLPVTRASSNGRCNTSSVV